MIRYAKYTDWRYERKFVIENQNIGHCESMIKLHPAMFSEAYPMRIINNIYLDSHGRNCYLSNQLDANERVKYRIRWYGAADSPVHISHPVLEAKIRRSTLGTKLRYSLVPFIFGRGFSAHILKEVFMKSELPELINEQLKLIEPVLETSYMRKYFLSANGKYRLTLDWNMKFRGINPLYATQCLRTLNHDLVLLELKYDKADDMAADQISSFFPYRLSKNSKYINGMDIAFF